MNEDLYKLPADWQWTTLDKFAECLDNIRVPVNLKERRKRAGSIPYYGATGRAGWIDDYLTDEQLVLLGEDGAPFLETFRDKAYIIEGKAWINNHVHVLRSYFGEAGNIYLKNYLNEFDYRGYINGSTRWKLTQSKMKTIPIPLPPIDELERIVNITETLLNKLSRAKEIAQNIVDGYELRRGKITYDAFNGKLTNSNVDDWVNVTLKDVCRINPPKVSTKNLPDELEVTFVPMPSVSAEYGTIKEPKTRKLVEVKTGFTNFSEGDVIFAKITPCMENGKSAIVKNLINDIGYGSTEFFVFRCGERLYNRYLYHLVRSKFFRDKAKLFMHGSVGQLRVPRSFLESYILKLPPIEEQREIVRHLDSLLTKEQQTKELAEKVLYNTKRMKKKILGMAFRGVI